MIQKVIAVGGRALSAIVQRVIGISIGDMLFENFSSPLNISLLHPFEEIRSLSLSVEQNGFNGFFDDVEGI